MIPYIGICDFPTGSQSLATARFFQEVCRAYKLENRKLMIGVMMSFKTLSGLPSKWTDVWPKKERVGSIFPDHPMAFNTIHYANYEGNTNLSYLNEAVVWGGSNLHTIQFDMIWPSEVMIKALRIRFPHLKTVLQINTRALEAVDNDPLFLVDALENYQGSIDYVLLDKSHGRGVEMNAEELLPFLRAISKHLPNIGLGVAGGLGPNTIDLAQPIVEEFPNVSIDAQGKLRPSGSAFDPIDWEMAHDYLVKAVKMFSR